MLILSIGCKTTYAPVKSEFDNMRVQNTQDTLGYSVTDKYLAPYRQKLQDSFSTVIATTTGDLVKRRPGGSLGNLVVEAVNAYFKQPFRKDNQFILMNYGGIRLKEIKKGPISMGKIFELLPFENTIVQVKISGKELSNLLAKINNFGGWPIRCTMSGAHQFKAKYWLHKINSVEEYSLITNNYVAAGGDNCEALKTLPQEDTGILLRDIVIEYLRKQKTITPDNTDYDLK